MYKYNVIENDSKCYISAPMEFELGQVVMTKGISDLLNGLPVQLLMPCLIRHQAGDWGDVCLEDKVANDEATHLGFRILSQYNFADEKIWIITEADRSVTTILLPSEY